MKKINWKLLITSILIPVIIGSIIGLITSSYTNFETLVKPSFSPPGILFPIVWTILYTLMGISIYLVKTSNTKSKDAIQIYVLQLIVNYLWSFIFFIFNLQLVAFFWIILLIILVLIMIIKFFWINPLSAYLQVPYIVWLIFAAVLNLSIYLLN